MSIRGWAGVVVALAFGLVVVSVWVAAVNRPAGHRGARFHAARAEMAGLEKAIEHFHVDQGRLPFVLQDLVIRPDYAKEWPEGGYLREGVIPRDPWGNEYVYRVPGIGRDVDLISRGADGLEGGDGDNSDIKLYDDIQK